MQPVKHKIFAQLSKSLLIDIHYFLFTVEVSVDSVIFFCRKVDIIETNKKALNNSQNKANKLNNQQLDTKTSQLARTKAKKPC